VFSVSGCTCTPATIAAYSRRASAQSPISCSALPAASLTSASAGLSGSGVGEGAAGLATAASPLTCSAEPCPTPVVVIGAPGACGAGLSGFGVSETIPPGPAASSGDPSSAPAGAVVSCGEGESGPSDNQAGGGEQPASASRRHSSPTSHISRDKTLLLIPPANPAMARRPCRHRGASPAG